MVMRADTFNIDYLPILLKSEPGIFMKETIPEQITSVTFFRIVET